MTSDRQSPEENRTQQGNPRSPRTKHRPSLLGYLIVLFLAAFVLLLMSYFMQQRRNDQAVIDGLQQSISAMQAKQNLAEQNKALIAQNNELTEKNESLEDQVSALKEQLEALTQQKESLDAQLEASNADLDHSEQVTLALDWLWRIEREYFKGRYSSARALIQAFQSTGLLEYLPDEPLVDSEYRTPRYQYDSIYDVLF